MTMTVNDIQLKSLCSSVIVTDKQFCSASLNYVGKEVYFYEILIKMYRMTLQYPTSLINCTVFASYKPSIIFMVVSHVRQGAFTHYGTLSASQFGHYQHLGYYWESSHSLNINNRLHK